MPPNDRISLSVFMPFYNEEHNVRRAVENTIKTLEETQKVFQYEIIIVNDGSTDSTEKVAQELISKYQNVRQITHEKNMGYGAALITGIRNSVHDYIFFMDGDLQFDINEINKLLGLIPVNRVVIGYRKKRNDSLIRSINSKSWKLLNSLIFGLNAKDPNCAFKLFRRDLVAHIPLVSNGAMISTEILIKLKAQGVDFVEVPVSHFPRQQGKPTGANIRVILKAFSELFILCRTNLGLIIRRQLFRFVLIGLLNTAIDFALYFILTRYTSYFFEHLVVAKVVSFLAGSICSFILNRTWTFDISNIRIRFAEIAKFYTSVGISVVGNALLMKFFISVLSIYDLYAVILSTIFTFVFNFTIYKLWVFRKKNE